MGLGEPKEALLAPREEVSEMAREATAQRQVSGKCGHPHGRGTREQFCPSSPPAEPEPSSIRGREAGLVRKAGTQVVPAGGCHGHVAGPTGLSTRRNQ